MPFPQLLGPPSVPISNLPPVAVHRNAGWYPSELVPTTWPASLMSFASHTLAPRSVQPSRPTQTDARVVVPTTVPVSLMAQPKLDFTPTGGLISVGTQVCAAAGSATSHNAPTIRRYRLQRAALAPSPRPVAVLTVVVTFAFLGRSGDRIPMSRATDIRWWSKSSTGRVSL